MATLDDDEVLDDRTCLFGRILGADDVVGNAVIASACDEDVELELGDICFVDEDGLERP